jgi:uncharacterized protein
MEFDWDGPKALANRRKHGVSFDEAKTIYEPQKPVILEDVDHSDAENRYYAIGISSKGRLLTVCFAYAGKIIRIVGARKANKREMAKYAQEIENRKQGS